MYQWSEKICKKIRQAQAGISACYLMGILCYVQMEIKDHVVISITDQILIFN